MNISINTEDEWQHSIDTLRLKPGVNLQGLVLGILTQAHTEDQPSCTVTVNATLLKSSSYVNAPGMFAKSIIARCPYPSVQSNLRDGKLIIRAGQEKTPATFRGRVLQELKESGTCIVPRAEVPATYRARPELLANAMRNLLNKSIRVKFNKESFTWKVVA